ncbi:hypothetical protein PENTCL1PPCAC_24366, partial [Pristionchus entomophagus]
TQLAPVFLFLANQDRVFLYLTIMFGLSCVLNATGLFFLIKQTPPRQAVVRKYLIIIQIVLIVNDVHLEMGFQPIPLFPILGGYAVGWLIQAGVSVLIEMCVYIIVYVFTGILIILCLIYRHQTVVLEGNKFKFRTV